jgi:hypothetical protein
LVVAPVELQQEYTFLKTGTPQPKELPHSQRKRARPRNSGRISADTNFTIPVLPPNHYPLPLEVAFRGVAGLGHRLFRQSNAYHLAKGLYLDSLAVDWGWCYSFDPQNRSHVTSHAEIFPHLFGNTTIPVPRQPPDKPRLPLVSFPFIQAIRWNDTLLQDDSIQTHKLEFVNEVWQYNERQHNMAKMKRQQYYGKDRSDLEMYQTMVRQFQFQDRIAYWKRELQFHNHTVIGLHIRHGNGEKGNFKTKNRGIQGVSEQEWISNFAGLLLNYTESWDSKPRLIFLATDSSNATNLALQLETHLARAATLRPKKSALHPPKVVTVEQSRIPDGKGVSYQYMFETKEACLEGWVAQMIDMILLAESNVVVAGQYSSFTQTIPLSFQFAKARSAATHEPNGLVCNVGVKATVMECFEDFGEWMARKSKVPLIGDPNGAKQEHKNLIPMPVYAMTLRNTLQQRLRDQPVELVSLV